MRFIEGFLAPAQAHDWLVQLENSDWVEWQRETFSIFGRQVDAPRTLTWFGDAGLNYRYTGVDHCAALGWPEPLRRLKDQVEMTAGQSFNFLLLNRYANGSEYMGWHRDDEQGCRGDIASLSLGASRRFSIDRWASSAAIESANAKTNACSRKWFSIGVRWSSETLPASYKKDLRCED